ncbi:MAG: efflux RND transporter periplasmic adaptor subunit [Planctomycetaceae bacterium]
MSVRSQTLRAGMLAVLALAAGTVTALLLAGREPARFSARIEAQTAFVNAAHAGIVAELLVKEGDHVSLEHPLATLTDPELDARIAETKAQVSVHEKELAQAEACAAVELAWRLKEIDNEIVATELQSADYLKEKFDWELERSMWADLLSTNETAMFDNGTPAFQSILLKSRVPGEQHMNAVLKHETADNAVAVSGVQVEICQESLSRLQRTKEELPARIRQKSGVEVAEQRLAQSLGTLARLEAQRNELVVKSTAIGAVGLFRARPGDHLQPGQTIVEILDDARRWVVASVPSSCVPEFEPQRQVKLTFPGGQVRTGTVVSIPPQADRAAGPDDVDPRVAVRIEQSGAAWPNVPLGSRVDVQLAE